jgi:hypothetical protein
MADLIDVELFPSMRCAAPTLTADLKTEQALDVTSNPVVVRFDDSGASGFVDELDETLITDRTHEIVVHWYLLMISRVLALGWRPGRVVFPTDHEDCKMRDAWPRRAVREVVVVANRADAPRSVRVSTRRATWLVLQCVHFPMDEHR